MIESSVIVGAVFIIIGVGLVFISMSEVFM